MRKIQVICWNVENFFHPESGGPRFDLTPHEGWTLERYEAKVARICAVLKGIFRESDGSGVLIGLTEVENERVVRDILAGLPERFKWASDSSFGRDYLDCVLIYDEETFELNGCRYNQMFERYPRGDVVQVDMRERTTGAELSVFNCHLKARPSNQHHTSMYRQAVCDEIQTTIWKMHEGEEVRNRIRRDKDGMVEKPESLTLDKNVVVMGDFNDEPFSPSLMEYLVASYDWSRVLRQRDLERVALYNCSWEWLMTAKPGSYFHERPFGSPWSMLDQMVVSPALLSGLSRIRYEPGSFRVIQDMTCDVDGKPLRMNAWDDDDNLIWLDGYSDHFPIEMVLNLEGEVSP
jgi:endonuclease/exonuclease/phosphatase family metal-dependent hydrolase